MTIIQKGRKEKVDHCSTVNIVKYFIKFAIRWPHNYSRPAIAVNVGY